MIISHPTSEITNLFSDASLIPGVKRKSGDFAIVRDEDGGITLWSGRRIIFRDDRAGYSFRYAPQNQRECNAVNSVLMLMGNTGRVDLRDGRIAWLQIEEWYGEPAKTKGRR